MHKKRIIAILLALFLGGFGVHRFYIGQIGWGLLFLVFCWTFIPSIFAIFDIVRWAVMGDAEFQNRYSTN